ncbi:MAG: hypothetical protein KKI09_04135 [Spirochaetes bacterium]|nr:hypothetical protein [Spirochaetota bacterium]MBU0954598.1 hypothetical protein [Spirochaetota bacterium]
MSISRYIDSPFFEVQAYRSDPPQDAVSFIGSPRKHPYDDSKIILIMEESTSDSAILEFRTADVLGAQEMPSPVNAEGESYSLVRLWVRRKAVGIRYEPFEVDEPLHFMHETDSGRDRLKLHVRQMRNK